MKRGLILWDEGEVSRAALHARCRLLREETRRVQAPAALVYTDVWRSNHVRALVNFMPFWSRSLLVLPVEGDPILLSGHSPRVYPWVRATSVLEDIRPGSNVTGALLRLLQEKPMRRLAVVDRPQLPYDIHRSLEEAGIEAVDVPWKSVFALAEDSVEARMRRTAAEKTRALVDEALEGGLEPEEHSLSLCARLERTLRRGGMEDTVIWLTDGSSPPRPPTTGVLGVLSSVVVAAEYRGHWAQLSRPLHGSPRAKADFLESLRDLKCHRPALFDLGTSHPFRAVSPDASLEPGSFLAVHRRSPEGLYYGDSCLATTETTAELL
jgi:hypothetical protein